MRPEDSHDGMLVRVCEPGKPPRIGRVMWSVRLDPPPSATDKIRIKFNIDGRHRIYAKYVEPIYGHDAIVEATLKAFERTA